MASSSWPVGGWLSCGVLVADGVPHGGEPVPGLLYVGDVGGLAEIAPVLRWHLSCFAQPGDDGVVFTGPTGALLPRQPGQGSHPGQLAQRNRQPVRRTLRAREATLMSTVPENCLPSL